MKEGFANEQVAFMTLQYIEAFKEIGASSSTRRVLPMEVTKMLGELGSFTRHGDRHS